MYARDCIYNKMKSISNPFKMKMSQVFEKQGKEFPGKTMLDVCVRGRKMLYVDIRMFYVCIYGGSYEGRR